MGSVLGSGCCLCRGFQEQHGGRLCPRQGPGESLCWVWEHSAASEERRRLPQQRHVIPVLGEDAFLTELFRAAFALGRLGACEGQGEPRPELILPTVVAAESSPGKKGRVWAGSLLWRSLFRNRPALRMACLPWPRGRRSLPSQLPNARSPLLDALGVAFRRRAYGDAYMRCSYSSIVQVCLGGLGESSLELRGEQGAVTPSPGSICPERAPGPYPSGGRGTENHRGSRHRPKGGGRAVGQGSGPSCGPGLALPRPSCRAGKTLAGPESGLLGVTEGPSVASASFQGWSSFATGASKFASAAKEGVSSLSPTCHQALWDRHRLAGPDSGRRAGS